MKRRTRNMENQDIEKGLQTMPTADNATNQTRRNRLSRNTMDRENNKQARCFETYLAARNGDKAPRKTHKTFGENG